MRDRHEGGTRGHGRLPGATPWTVAGEEAEDEEEAKNQGYVCWRG